MTKLIRIFIIIIISIALILLIIKKKTPSSDLQIYSTFENYNDIYDSGPTIWWKYHYCNNNGIIMDDNTLHLVRGSGPESDYFGYARADNCETGIACILSIINRPDPISFIQLEHDKSGDSNGDAIAQIDNSNNPNKVKVDIVLRGGSRNTYLVNGNTISNCYFQDHRPTIQWGYLDCILGVVLRNQPNLIRGNGTLDDYVSYSLYNCSGGKQIGTLIIKDRTDPIEYVEMLWNKGGDFILYPQTQYVTLINNSTQEVLTKIQHKHPDDYINVSYLSPGETRNVELMRP